MASVIDYGNLMHRAMRGLMRDVLSGVEANGLPGAHHFFITIRTHAEGVVMADWLRDRYPEEITIVLQNWYENLAVDEDGFTITLNFGNSPEPMYIPFDAISTFVDPSVEFGLRFETHDSDEDDDADVAEAPMDEGAEEPASPPQQAEIVRLDNFRK